MHRRLTSTRGFSSWPIQARFWLQFNHLPRTALPLRIKAAKFDGSDEVISDATIEAEPFTIPPLEKIHKSPIRAHIRSGNGSESEILMW